MAPRQAHLAALLIVVIGFGLAATRAFQVPMWTGYFHERDNLNAARIAVENRRFPRPSDYPPGQFEIQQGSQPPLYLLATAPVTALFDDGMSLDLPGNPTPVCTAGGGVAIDVQMDTRYNAPYGGTVRAAYALRLLSAAFVMGGALLVYMAGRVLAPERPSVAVAGAAFVAWGPYFIWMGSRIINDSLLVLVAGAFTYALARMLRAEALRPFDIGLLVAVMAGAVLTKLTGWVLFGVGALALLVVGGRTLIGTRPSRQALLRAGAVLGGLLLIFAALLTYNQLATGSVFGRYSNLETIAVRLLARADTLPGTVVPALRDTLTHYTSPLRDIGVRGRYVRAYARLTALVALAGAAGVAWLVARRQWRDLRTIGWLLLPVLGATALVVLRNHIAFSGGTRAISDGLIYAPVRYYAVGTPPMALALSLMLSGLIPQRWRGWHPLGAGAALLWLVVSVAVVASENRPALIASAISTAPSDATLLAAPLDGSLLLYDGSTTATDGAAQVTLTMGVTEPPAVNWMGQVTLTGADGTEVRCQFLPVRGLYPTPRWEVGQAVTDTVSVPNCVRPLAAPVTVRADWVNPTTDEVIRGAALPPLETAIGLSDACPPNFGRVAGSLQAVAIKVPATARPGDRIEPFVDYDVLSDPIPVETRTIRLEGAQETYTCSGLRTIHGTVITFGESRRNVTEGQRIYLDACVIRLPEDTPPGAYDVVVVYRDANGEPLPVNAADGTTSDDGRLQIGVVTVEAAS